MVATEPPVAPAADDGTNLNDEQHTSAMIAAVPADPESLAVPGGLAASDLHVTLCFMGDAGEVDSVMRAVIDDALGEIATASGPFDVHVMGIAEFNGATPDACVVLLVESDELAALRCMCDDMGVDASEHSNYIPHLTLGYGLDPAVAEAFQGQDITIGSLVAAYGPERHEHPLVGAPEQPAEVQPAPAPADGGETVLPEGNTDSAGASYVTTAEFGAVRSHKTATTSDAWDGAANEARLPSPMSRTVAANAYGWIDSSASGELKKSDCRFIHHMVGQDGKPGAANTTACSTGIGVLHGGRGGTTIPDADRRGVYNHLASHLRDAGMSPPDFEVWMNDSAFADAPTPPDAPAAAPAADPAVADAPVPKDPVPEGTSYDAAWGDGSKWATFVPNPNQPNGQWDLTLVFKGAATTVKGGQIPQPINDKVNKLVKGAGYTVKYETPDDPLTVDTADGKAQLMLTENQPGGGAAAPADQAPSDQAPAAAAVVADAQVGIGQMEDNSYRWRGILVEEGIPSGDGRFIDEGALAWRDLPLPLMLKTKNEGQGHEGADLAGRIESITREGRSLIGEGSFDSGEAGERARQLVGDGMLRGLSVDLDSVELEWENEPPGADASLEEMFDFDPGMMIVTAARIMGVTVTPFPAFQEANIELIDGSVDTEADTMEAAVDPGAVAEGDAVQNDDGRTGVVAAVVADPATIVVVADDTGAVEAWPAETVTPVGGGDTSAPAPDQSQPSDQAPMAASAGDKVVPLRARWNAPVGEKLSTLVANAGPVHPPATWFETPPQVIDSDGRKIGYPVRVSKEGRVYGCVARWDDVHIGMPGRRKPPSSPSNYANFRTGQTLTAEGTLVATGRIVCNTVHPKLRLAASDAAAWYADTGCAVADVAVYEDEIGIWVAGATRPDATEMQVRILRGSDVSPDWRDVNGRLDCVGMLCVNASGFIVEGLVASASVTSAAIRGAQGFTNAQGRVTALVAAGMVSRSHPMSDHVERRLGELEAMVASLDAERSERERPARVAAARAALDAAV